MHAEVVYDNQTYKVPGRDAAEVRAEIEAILASAAPGWIQVRDGSPNPFHLLVHTGVALAVVDMPDSGD